MEGVRTETYVSLDGGKESLSSGSFSVGRAGGGGHPAGTTRVIVDTFFEGFFNSNILSSRCLNPIISVLSCLFVSSSLACELARACSKAARRSSTEPGNACCGGVMAFGKTEGESGDGRVHRTGRSRR